jgi:HSP20 family protein
MSFLSRGHRQRMSPITSDIWPVDMERFFNDTFRRVGLSQSANLTNQLSDWSPKVDISETDSEIKVMAELPGLSEKDIDLSFHNNTLTIKGEREFHKENEKENYYCVETSYGSFRRVIPFDVKIDPEKIKAEFKKGILNVHLAKSEDVMNSSRKIKIN